jgi:hypothetical protein
MKTMTLAVMLIATAALAQKKFAKDFSAERWVGASKDLTGGLMGKVYVHESKARMETGEGEKQVVMLADINSGQGTMMQHKKAWLVGKDEPVPEALKGALWWSPLVVDWDAKNGPCGSSKTVTCKALGDEKIDGRDASKWEVTSKTGKATVWIDSALHITLKQVGDGGWMKIANIHEGPQPAELFKVPADHEMIAKPTPTTTTK